MSCRGESYIDIIDRLQPVIFELERNTQPIVVVSHQAVLRCLLAYFLDIQRSMIPYISFIPKCIDFLIVYFSIPFHTLIRIVPRDSTYDEERMPLHPLDVYDEIPKRMIEMEKLHQQNKMRKQEK